MDINTLRIALMLLAFAGFLALAWNSYRPQRRRELDAAARLPLADELANDDNPQGTAP
jgi:cbb3-type cytochrome oxidase subunit 3